VDVCDNVTIIAVCFVQILNVQVPFIFKYLVNHLNDPSEFLTMLTPQNTIITVTTALVLGCKCIAILIHLLCVNLIVALHDVNRLVLFTQN